MKRLYHPRLDSFIDVEDSAVDAHVEAGWRKSKPQHVHIPDGTPKPGEGPGIARVTVDVPLLEDVSPSTTTASAPAARRGGRAAARSGSAATSSTATGSTPTA